METHAKARIALFGFGILGGGSQGEGIPVLHDLFSRLSDDFEISFYTFTRVDTRKIDPRIKVIQPPAVKIPGRLKYLYIGLRCAIDHLVARHSLIFAVAAYPTGKAAVRLAKILKVPSVVQLIALEAVAITDIGAGNLAKPHLKLITQQVCAEARSLVMVADFQKKVAMASLPSDREMVVLPLRIDPTKFPYRERSISFPVKMIQVAYYSPVKDQNTMFAAFAKVADQIDCHLTVVGDGFNVEPVRALMKKLKIENKVTFTGSVSQAELPRYYSDAHILLHAARFETGCAVIQEAMASGVAVCGTNVGILSDIGPAYAMISPPQDADAMADNIIRLINNPQLYRRLTDTARQWIVNYDSVWAYHNYRDFLRGLID